MLTPKEVQGIIDQVNQSFEGVYRRVEALEKTVEELKSAQEAKPKPGRPSKKTQETE